MEKLLKEGIIFSIVIIALFTLIGFISYNLNSPNAKLNLGFPLSWYETPNCEVLGGCGELFREQSVWLNIVLAVILGFGISYAKNSMVKK